jgi:hypothetical protein
MKTGGQHRIAIPAAIPPLPLNQSTRPADGSLYRQSQVVWIGKYTIPSVVDFKFCLAIRTDSFTRNGISDGFQTERAFQIDGIVKGVHEKGMPLIFVCKKLNLILHTKIRGQMKSDKIHIPSYLSEILKQCRDC